jgi:hypothetical protein
MRVIGIVACAAIALAIAVPSASVARGGHSTKVVCVNKNFKRVYRETPKTCSFHKRGEPIAEAFLVNTKNDRWHVWRRSHARGKGKNVASMGQTQRVRIKLKNPVRKCGHRVFSRAHFFFPKSGHGTTLALDVCA